jgi:hypothetical protein
MVAAQVIRKDTLKMGLAICSLCLMYRLISILVLAIVATEHPLQKVIVRTFVGFF